MLKTVNSERPGTNGGPKRRARDMCNKFSAARILHICLPCFTGSPRNSFRQTRELTLNRVVPDLPSLYAANAKAPGASSAIGVLVSQTTTAPPQYRLKRSNAVGRGLTDWLRQRVVASNDALPEPIAEATL